MVATTLTAVQTRDRLLRYLDRNDGLFVVRLSGEAAWYGLNGEVTKWLQD